MDAAPTRAAINPGRDAALRRLTRMARRFPDLPFADVDEKGLDARDAALAHAIVDAAARRWLTLRFLIDLGLKTEFEALEASVQGALLAGAAQLAVLDGAPARAVVHETVEWAKGGKRPRGSALVNAGLRRVAELFEDSETHEPLPIRGAWADALDEIPLSDGRARTIVRAALPEDRLRRLSITTSNPLDLLRHWSRSMSAQEVRAVAAHGLVAAPVILNTAHAREPLPEGLLSPHQAPGRHVFTGSHAALHDLLARRRDIWAQDPGSSQAVASVSDLQPSLIVDVCAGRGTKTRQLAAMFPGARIVASDTDGERRRAAAEVFRGEERVSVAAPESLAGLAGTADLVLVDAPCSNTGVLARRVEARYRVSEESVGSLIGVQRQILADSVRLLAPGGVMLYSTCSLDPRENEDQLAWANRWHGLTPDRVRRALPTGLPGEPPERYSDGSFSGVLA